MLGLGTPEVERWINAGKAKPRQQQQQDRNALKRESKTVYFKDEDNDAEEEAQELLERARKLSLQISPRRPGATATTPASGSVTVDSSWSATAAANPPTHSLVIETHHPANTSAGSAVPTTTTSSSTAHDLLKTIIQDVMFDFQRETKAEMMGLHLDLLRMGRSWKAELRALMEEYVGDLREMREENERLRRENERLRRGWQ